MCRRWISRCRVRPTHRQAGSGRDREIRRRHIEQRRLCRFSLRFGFRQAESGCVDVWAAPACGIRGGFSSPLLDLLRAPSTHPDRVGCFALVADVALVVAQCIASAAHTSAVECDQRASRSNSSHSARRPQPSCLSQRSPVSCGRAVAGDVRSAPRAAHFVSAEQPGVRARVARRLLLSFLVSRSGLRLPSLRCSAHRAAAPPREAPQADSD